MIRLVKVRGASMAPTLAAGDYMIITNARALRPGFVVLVDHPKYGSVVKRVKAIEDGHLSLEGDGPESTATKDMGLVSVTAVKGRVRWAIRPHGLLGLKRL